MSSLFCPLLRCLFPSFLHNHLYKFNFSQSEESKDEKNEQSWKSIYERSFEFQTRDFVGLVVAVLIGLWYAFTRHWIANNLIALTLCILAIEFIRLNKFVNGFLLLGGLFFYDIFWVFGTPVMVSVAKSLEAPIKVVFPRDFLLHGIFGKQLALLGLGDIVIPGVFVALLLRFDDSLRKGQKSYFHIGYLAYIVGLLMTFVVMHTFNAAQPALLYLVPTCLSFPLCRALIKGELQPMLDYVDVPESSEEVTPENTKKDE